MSKGTFNPGALNTPSTVYTNTSTKQAIYQVYIDCTEMVSTEILKIQLRTDTTLTTKIYLEDLVTKDGFMGNEAVVVSYPVLLDADETYSVVLTQTAGTLRDYFWSVNVVEQ